MTHYFNSLSKYFLALFIFPALSHAQSSITEAKPSEWNDSLKSSVAMGQIKRANKVLFKIKKEGALATISLPRKVSMLEVNTWIFEVNYEGHSFYATWNQKAKGWCFTLMGNGTHKVYVSKRRNNTKSDPYAWFVLGI